MQIIPLSAVPNQTFTVTLDNNRYLFAVYDANGSMSYDITVNEISGVDGQRLVDGTFLLPFASVQGLNGNFLLLTQNDDLPDWTQFGTTQTLIYLSFDEMQAAVNAAPTYTPPLVPYKVV